MGTLIQSTAKAIGEALGPGPRSKVVVMHPEWVRFIAHEAKCCLEDLERMERDELLTVETGHLCPQKNSLGRR